MRRALLLALCLCACEEEKPAPRVFAAPPQFQEGLVRVLDKYAIVRKGLAANEAVLSANALSSMHGELHALPVDGLDSAGKAWYDSVDAAMMSVLHDEAMNAGGLPALRRAFAGFSPLLGSMLKAYGVTEKLPVFLFRCPGEGGGAWLQADADLAGPYPDSSGRPCGELVERL